MIHGTISDFLRRATEDEALRADLLALALKHGFTLTPDELADEELGEVSGGLGPSIPVQKLGETSGHASSDSTGDGIPFDEKLEIQSDFNYKKKKVSTSLKSGE